MSGSFNPPASPTVGQIYTFGGATWRWDGVAWVNASTGANFVSITGSTMTGPLVLSGNAPASAPLQAVPQQQVAVAIAAAPDNVGRNLLHNGMFNVQQRGVGPWSAALSYTADRWLMGFTGGTLSTSINATSDAARAQIGDEAMMNVLAGVCAGGAAANNETYYEQRIENLHRTSGKTLTLSFVAAATSGTPQVGFMIYQSFGSGGSPSPVVVVPGQPVTISTTYTRYSVTIPVPSVAGKTFGTTAGTDFLGVRLGMSAGSTNSPNYGGIGVQSATFAFWGLQLEIGSVATPLEKLDPQQDLANCQRFYQQGQIVAGGYSQATLTEYGSSMLVVTMRAIPTLTIYNNVSANLGTPTIASQSPSAVYGSAPVTATGQFVLNYFFNASADL